VLECGKAAGFEHDLYGVQFGVGGWMQHFSACHIQALPAVPISCRMTCQAQLPTPSIPN
jgi:hypothetical protein